MQPAHCLLSLHRYACPFRAVTAEPEPPFGPATCSNTHPRSTLEFWILVYLCSFCSQAFLLFAVETLRFKTASVVKIHKLGAVSEILRFNKTSLSLPLFQLVQSFKDIRSKACAVLKTMSNDLSKMAEVAGSAERRKSFVEACQPIMVSPKVGTRVRLSGYALTSSFCSCIMTLCST